ncbi:MAG TPA: acyloxyacyl hydrolase [Stellaceae bacterium]|nr:acyloxyacyl hydrolase [Stellaceae bacterium]
MTLIKGIVVGGLALAIVAGASESSFAAAGPIDELDIGVLAHDVPIGDDHRENGADVNLETLFVSPAFLAPIWAPRPHLGLTINTLGKNSWAYGGLTWTLPIGDSFFGNLGLGGAVHDGPDDSVTRDHVGLGTRLLFHESVELGYRFLPGWNTGLYLEHVSNADLGSHNPGITDLGLRFGHSF